MLLLLVVAISLLVLRRRRRAARAGRKQSQPPKVTNCGVGNATAPQGGQFAAPAVKFSTGDHEVHDVNTHLFNSPLPKGAPTFPPENLFATTPVQISQPSFVYGAPDRVQAINTQAPYANARFWAQNQTGHGPRNQPIDLVSAGGGMSHEQRLEIVVKQLESLEGRTVCEGLVIKEGSSNRLQGGLALHIRL